MSWPSFSLAQMKPQRGYPTVMVAGQACQLHSAQAGPTFNPANTWALDLANDGSTRFEVRHGDICWFDEGADKERSEVETVQRHPYRKTMVADFTLTIEEGPANTALWMTLFQVHDGNPTRSAASGFSMMSLELTHGDRFAASIRHDDGKGNLVEKLMGPGDWKPMTRGHAYKVHFALFASNSDQGHALITLDGVPLIDYSGPAGYTAGATLYPQYGVYRHAALETIAARYHGMQIR